MPDIKLTVQFDKPIEEINAIVKEHNEKSDSFDKEKNDAFSKLEKHYASEFIVDTQYFEQQDKIEELKKVVGSKKSKSKEIENRCTTLEGRLSESVKGAERINHYLKAYFAKDDISVRVTQDKSFQLFRGENRAKNLSGGEKTAISFIYFMTKLEDKGSVLSDSIVFLDDPISSLDINHLFNTYSFIKNQLSSCKQLFISTHNFEFLNLIKDWLKDKHKSQSAFYLVERCSLDCSYYTRMIDMPIILSNFKSEYHYLFSILYEFYQSTSADHRLLFTIPNLARRYLEAYLGFKIPKSQGLPNKLNSWMPDDIKREMVLKFLNQYSHNSGLPRALLFPDLSECKQVIGVIFDRVQETDSEHFSALIEEITVS